MPASTLIEFEPIAANQLLTQAGRSLGLGSFVAALLTLAAILFWRQTSRYENERRECEQRRRLSQLGEMSAVMAHEIRNPLASLKGNAQLLAEKLTAGTREKSKADRIVVEATRLEALTTDLLEFARSGPIELTPSNPSDVLQAAVSEVGSEGFEVETEDAPKQWNLDPKRLRYALVNVLQNALQASPARAPHIRVGQEADRLVYEVRDFGPGLSPGTEARLFDPFFTTRTNGTGLGLAVALRAAEFHGGTITASNHPDGGAVFRIVLPPSSN
jgi:two-component system sensor histidine kinase HydH